VTATAARDGLLELLEDGVKDGPKDRVDVAEVVVDGRRGDARFPGDAA